MCGKRAFTFHVSFFRSPNVGAASLSAPSLLGDPQQQEGHEEHLPGRRLQFPGEADRLEVLHVPLLRVSNKALWNNANSHFVASSRTFHSVTAAQE